MTVPDQSLDPHLEEVLRDIEGDPRARMFQASPRQLVTVLTDRSPRLSSRQAGLTSAERELLTVHREELAYLLCTAAKIALASRETPRISVGRWLTTEKSLDPPSRKEHLTRAEYCGEVCPPELRPHAVLSRVRTTSDEPLAPRGAYGLALAALRLVPQLATRILLACTLSEDGKDHSAYRILNDVLYSRSSSTNRVIALINTSSVLDRLGDPVGAIASLDSLVRAGGSHVTAAMNNFCLRLKVGDRSGAMDAADWLSAIVPTEHPAIAEFVHNRVQQRGTSMGRPTRDCRRVLRKIRRRLPEAARRIADVYVQ